MSKDEIRSYCESISSYQLRVQVRLRNGYEVFYGKVSNTEADRFELITDEQEVKTLPYNWVTRITNA